MFRRRRLNLPLFPQPGDQKGWEGKGLTATWSMCHRVLREFLQASCVLTFTDRQLRPREVTQLAHVHGNGQESPILLLSSDLSYLHGGAGWVKERSMEFSWRSGWDLETKETTQKISPKHNLLICPVSCQPRVVSHSVFTEGLVPASRVLMDHCWEPQSMHLPLAQWVG